MLNITSFLLTFLDAHMVLLVGFVLLFQSPAAVSDLFNYLHLN
jgi:hypothetical protein